MNQRYAKLADKYEPERFRRAALIFAGVGVLLVMGAVGASFTGFPAEQQTVQKGDVATQTTTTEAVVTESTALYQEGETVSNSGLYLRNEMSDPRVEATTQLPAVTTDTQATQQMYVRLEALKDKNVIWERVYPIDTERGSSATLTTEGTIDIEELYTDAEQVRDVFYSEPTFDSSVVVQTTYSGPGGEQTTMTTLPLSVNQNTYSVGNGSMVTEDTYQYPAQQTVERPEQVRNPLAFLAVLLFGLAGVSLKLRAAHSPSRTQWEYDKMEHSDEWVSAGTTPTEFPDRALYVSSFSDVVDIAIDSDTRTIYNEEAELIFTIADDTFYYSTRDGEQLDRYS